MKSSSELGDTEKGSYGPEQLPPMVDTPVLRLYIARSTPNSVRAEQNLGSVLASLGAARATIVPDIIDVFANGKRAVADGVIVTPTLVLVRDNKRYTLVGDLSDASQLRTLLEP